MNPATAPTPAPRSQAPPRRRASPLTPYLNRSNLDRLILAVVTVGSVFAIWLSFDRLGQSRRRSAQLVQQVTKLSADIDVMRQQWPENRTKEISRRFREIPGSLFPGNGAVADWIESLERAAIPLGLQVSVNVRGTRSITNATGTVTVVQAEVRYPPAPEVDSRRSAYQRVLDFTQQLANSRQRVDLLETTLIGSTNALESASSVIEVWASDSPVAPTVASTQHAANP